MERPAGRAGCLKALVLTAIMLLSAATMAQQEANPDIYGDTAPAVQKTTPVKQARKASAPRPKDKAEARASKQPQKAAAERKLAASNRHKPMPAALQPGR